MDSTAVQIVCGLLVAATHAGVTALRQRTFDLGTTVTLLLGGVAIPAGIDLIRCAVDGDSSHLPSTWRIQLSVAGVAMLGLAAHKIAVGLRAAWVKPAVPTTPPDGAT